MSKKPNWKKIPTVEDLKADLTSAQPSHQAHCDKIDKWLKKLAGEVQASAKPVKGRSQVQPKLIRKHAEWRYSSLEEPFLSTKDLFDIDPMTAEDVNGADENEILINYQWNTKINKVRFINEYVRTAVDEGTVIVQVGWLHEKEKRKVNVAVRLTPEQLQMKLYAMVSQGQLTQEEAIAKMQDPNEYVQWVKREQEYVKHNHPVVRICEYDRVIVDPTCEGDIEKAQFVIVPTETSISELLKDGTYDLSELFTDSTMSEIDKSKIDDDTFYSTFSSSQREKQLNPFTFKDVARKKLTMYEYYGYWDVDGDNKTRAIKAVWIGNTLIKLEELPFPDNKLPFVLVQFMPERKSIYGTPDGKLIEDNQDILGAVLRGIIDIMGRSANGQQLLAKDFLDPINQLKYDKGENAYFNPGKDPRLSVHMQTFPEIPNSAMQMIDLLNTDAESLTGVMAFNTGISGQALGNMLDITIDIPMIDGSFKKLSHVVDGDLLVGSDGKATKVLKAHEIKFPEIAYDMHFDNGSIVKSGGEHLWTVKVHGTKHSLREWTTMTADEVYKYIQKGKRVTIPAMKEIHTGVSTGNSIDPYVLGYWLGDGMSHSSRITTEDIEVLSYFREAGYECVEVKDSSKSGNAKMYDVYKIGYKPQKCTETGQFISTGSLHSELRELGVMARYGGEKHIPEEYFTATYEEKMELIRGLMDSDGYAHSGSFVQFCQSESRLKDDMIKLIESLGLKTSIVKRCKVEINKQKIKLHEKTGGKLILATKDSYEIGFTPWSNPFKLNRKAQKWKLPYKQTVTLKSMVITDKVLMRCLTVDSEDKLFAVTDKFTLTHNTATGVRGELDSASKRELGILRRLSQGIEQIGRKIVAMNSEFLTDEEVIRVTNREFRTIKKDDLAGDYDLRVNISTAESDNQKIEKLAFMLQTLGQNMGTDLLQLILADIAKLQKMPELAEKLAAYQPQPDPMAQKLQELEIRKLEVDIEKTQADIADKYARADENKIDAEMKAAKVDEIRANTRMKHSTADQQDQEFLQKDLGIDKQHEMNMENLKGQQTMEQSALDHLMTMKQMNAQTKNTKK